MAAPGGSTQSLLADLTSEYERSRAFLEDLEQNLKASRVAAAEPQPVEADAELEAMDVVTNTSATPKSNGGIKSKLARLFSRKESSNKVSVAPDFDAADTVSALRRPSVVMFGSELADSPCALGGASFNAPRRATSFVQRSQTSQGALHPTPPPAVMLGGTSSFRRNSLSELVPPYPAATSALPAPPLALQQQRRTCLETRRTSASNLLSAAPTTPGGLRGNLRASSIEQPLRGQFSSSFKQLLHIGEATITTGLLSAPSAGTLLPDISSSSSPRSRAPQQPLLQVCRASSSAHQPFVAERDAAAVAVAPPALARDGGGSMRRRASMSRYSMEKAVLGLGSPDTAADGSGSSSPFRSPSFRHPNHVTVDGDDSTAHGGGINMYGSGGGDVYGSGGSDLYGSGGAATTLLAGLLRRAAGDGNSSLPPATGAGCASLGGDMVGPLDVSALSSTASDNGMLSPRARMTGCNSNSGSSAFASSAAGVAAQAPPRRMLSQLQQQHTPMRSRSVHICNSPVPNAPIVPPVDFSSLGAHLEQAGPELQRRPSLRLPAGVNSRGDSGGAGFLSPPAEEGAHNSPAGATGFQGTMHLI